MLRAPTGTQSRARALRGGRGERPGCQLRRGAWLRRCIARSAIRAQRSRPARAVMLCCRVELVGRICRGLACCLLCSHAARR